MILYREELFNSIQQNVIMLEVEEWGGYVYLSQATYDQAILLNDRFEGELGLLKQILEVTTEHKDVVDYFYNTAPEPLSILAPFLSLISEDVELEEDFIQLCGVLHMLSMTIDFNEFTKVHASIRADVKFGKSTLMNYKKSWDDITRKITTEIFDKELLNEFSNILYGCVHEMSKSTAEMLEGLIKIIPSQAVMYGQPMVQAAIVQTEEIEEEEEELPEDPWAQLGEFMKEEEARKEKLREEQKKKDSTMSMQEVREVEEAAEEETLTEEEDKIMSVINKFGGVKK